MSIKCLFIGWLLCWFLTNHWFVVIFKRKVEEKMRNLTWMGLWNQKLCPDARRAHAQCICSMFPAWASNNTHRFWGWHCSHLAPYDVRVLRTSVLSKTFLLSINIAVFFLLVFNLTTPRIHQTLSYIHYHSWFVFSILSFDLLFLLSYFQVREHTELCSWVCAIGYIKSLRQWVSEFMLPHLTFLICS